MTMYMYPVNNFSLILILKFVFWFFFLVKKNSSAMRARSNTSIILYLFKKKTVLTCKMPFIWCLLQSHLPSDNLFLQ